MIRTLAYVLAAEKFCQIKLDQDGIVRFVIERVSPRDIAFASDLEPEVAAAQLSYEQMSTAQLAASCVEVQRVVREYGFLRPSVRSGSN